MFHIIILAGGKGSRMGSSMPKVLHPLGGQALIFYIINEALSLNPSNCFLVVSPELQKEFFKSYPLTLVEQNPSLGTGDAVRRVFAQEDLSGEILVLCGDTPLIQRQTLTKLLAHYRSFPKPVLMLVGMRVQKPNQYARIVLDPQGQVEAVIEAQQVSLSDALYNSGLLLGPAQLIKDLTQQITPHQPKGEYYLTDCINLALQQAIPVQVFAGLEEEFAGVNTQQELAAAESVLQERWRSHWLGHGVQMTDPSTIYLSHDTALAPGVQVAPFVTFGPGVKVHNRSKILSFCHLEQTEVGESAIVGPFAHLRGGNKLGANVVVGNFVEIKNAYLKEGVKAKHLSYLGDVDIGYNSQIGAGTICCNYNGVYKAKTTLGNHVFIGSNTSLIAPLVIEDGAMIAAGSVINEDVPANALAIARPRPVIKADGAQTFRTKLQQN